MPGYDSDFAASNSSVGAVDFLGNGVSSGSLAVRPALWVNIESVCATKATADDSTAPDSNKQDKVTYENARTTFEGNGYDSPEEAVYAYLQAFKDGDMDKMISTFAIESYVENFDMVARVERIHSMSETMMFITTEGELARGINIYHRVADISDWIEKAYLRITGSMAWEQGVQKTYKGLEEDYGSIEEFLKVYYAEEENTFLEGFRIGETLSYKKMCDLIYDITGREYDTDSNKANIERQLSCYCAEDNKIVAQLYYVGDECYIFFPQTVRYNGRWYILGFNSQVSNFLNISNYCVGAALVSGSEEENIYIENYIE